MPESKYNQAFLSLGSNINPETNLALAVRKISEEGEILKVSSVWKTKPVGFLEQESFLNAAVLLQTMLSAKEICEGMIPRIERDLERVRDPENKNGPRTIDIDLTLYNSETFIVNHHQIPDPDMLVRGFVAIPIAELDPDYIHPVANKSLRVIASKFDPEKLEMILMKGIELGI